MGGVCGTANVLGEEVCRMHSSYQNNQVDQDLQQRMIEPTQVIFGRYGVGGLKAAMEMFGFYGGPTRSPLPNASQEAKQHLRQTFINNGFQPK